MLGLAGAWLSAAAQPPGPAGQGAAATAVYDATAVDTPAVLLTRTIARTPANSRPPFGAQLVVEFVVDPQGQTREVTIVAARATLASGRVFEEADLATLRRLGDLDGIPPGAPFPEVIRQLTAPFRDPGVEAVSRWRYRAATKDGVAVASRVTATVNIAGLDSRPLATQRNTVVDPVTIEPYRPPVVPAPSDRAPETPAPPASTLVIAGAAGGGSTIQTPGQLPTSVLSAAGGNVIFTPGQPPTTVVATPGGGSTVYTPGQPPTTVVRVSGTESIIYTPGQPQSTVVATPGGGSTIYTPGQPPTTVVPIAGGGSIIYAPGQPPVVVQPTP